MNNLPADFLKEMYQHRWALNHGDSDEKETEEYWNERAENFSLRAHSQPARNEALQFLGQFSWNPQETVLDVASGPGTFAVPLARKVAEVTATDFSSAMLEQLQLQAQTENISNIKTVQGRWLELGFDRKFSTVLCLNSLGVIATDADHNAHLDLALKKLKDICEQRLIMLIPHADTPLSSEIRTILQLDEISLESRRIAVLYYAMIECGMLPDLRIIRKNMHWSFASIKEACNKVLARAGIIDKEKYIEALETCLEKRLKKTENGALLLEYQVAQALFTWER